MRLFRGKRKDSGKWVYGYYYQIWDKVYILWGMTNGVPDMIEVIPETVGQYTGLKDKNGKEIYEGDRIRLDLNNEGYKDTVVVYRDDYMQFMFDHPKGVYTMTEYHFKPKDLEIIGNIHEEEKQND